MIKFQFKNLNKNENQRLILLKHMTNIWKTDFALFK